MKIDIATKSNVGKGAGEKRGVGVGVGVEREAGRDGETSARSGFETLKISSEK